MKRTRRTLLLMSLHDVQTCSLDDVPSADGRVVAARDAVSAVRSDGADCVGVTLEAVVVKRVFRRHDGVVVLARPMRLRVARSRSAGGGERASTNEETNVGDHRSLRRAVVRFTLARQTPDADGAVPRARDDERIRREELAVGLPDRFDDLQASLFIRRQVSKYRARPSAERKARAKGKTNDGGGVPVEDVSLNLTLDRPHADGPIGRARDEHVALVLESPDAALMAVESDAKLAIRDVVDVD